MTRAFLGLMKGLLIGGAVGAALLRLGSQNAALVYLGCALVGLLVGLACGRAPWRAETIWTPVLKMLVGVLMGAGLCYLGRRFLPDLALPSFPALTALAGKDPRLTLHAGEVLAPLIGVLYGIFVEVDDGSGKEDRPRHPHPVR